MNKTILIIGLILVVALAGCTASDNNDEAIMLKDQLTAEEDTSSNLQIKLDQRTDELELRTAELTDTKDYCEETIGEKEENLIEMYDMFYNCYWAYVCSDDPSYCLNERDFSANQLYTAKIACEYSPKYDEWMEEYFEE